MNIITTITLVFLAVVLFSLSIRILIWTWKSIYRMAPRIAIMLILATILIYGYSYKYKPLKESSNANHTQSVED